MYLKAASTNRTERNLFAIDRIVEHIGEQISPREIKVSGLRDYQRAGQKKVANSTVNREPAVLCGVMRVQVENQLLDFNLCLHVRRLPANQRDSYLSWEDYNRLLDHSWWMRDIVVMLYNTGMRFNEVVSLRWEMYKPERRMLILPPSFTKEGKNPQKARLKPKRVPLRREAVEILDALRKSDDEKVVKAVGLIFAYNGRFKNHFGTYQGKAIDRSMVRKCWARATRLSELPGLQIRDFRHTWKTNAPRSGMHPAVANAIVGHSSVRPVEDRYVRVSDDDLLRAVDTMTFDHGGSELDFVEEIPQEARAEKGMEGVWKMAEKKKKAVR